MAADPPKPDPRVIAAYVDDVVLELDAAKRLVADPPNRLAAFHLQQAAEKLVKAVRLGRGLRVTADHDIALLAEDLPQDDPWRMKFRALEPLSSYATTYRYPSPMGNARVGRARTRSSPGS
jgi:HEPN domain-containing protein